MVSLAEIEESAKSLRYNIELCMTTDLFLVMQRRNSSSPDENYIVVKDEQVFLPSGEYYDPEYHSRITPKIINGLEVICSKMTWEVQVHIFQGLKTAYREAFPETRGSRIVEPESLQESLRDFEEVHATWSILYMFADQCHHNLSGILKVMHNQGKPSDILAEQHSFYTKLRKEVSKVLAIAGPAYKTTGKLRDLQEKDSPIPYEFCN